MIQGPGENGRGSKHSHFKKYFLLESELEPQERKRAYTGFTPTTLVLLYYLLYITR
jgi:hypothetical protein